MTGNDCPWTGAQTAMATKPGKSECHLIPSRDGVLRAVVIDLLSLTRGRRLATVRETVQTITRKAKEGDLRLDPQMEPVVAAVADGLEPNEIAEFHRFGVYVFDRRRRRDGKFQSVDDVVSFYESLLNAPEPARNPTSLPAAQIAAPPTRNPPPMSPDEVRRFLETLNETGQSL
jgi:hypothetical protein